MLQPQEKATGLEINGRHGGQMSATGGLAGNRQHDGVQLYPCVSHMHSPNKSFRPSLQEIRKVLMQDALPVQRRTRLEKKQWRRDFLGVWRAACVCVLAYVV